MVIEIHQIFVNRRGLNSIEFEDSEIEIEISPEEERIVEFLIVNYGTPTHVNVSVSEELRNNVKLLKENPYVKYEEVVPALVTLEEGELRGELIVTTGYGAYRSSVPLVIRAKDKSKEISHIVEISPRTTIMREEGVERRRFSIVEVLKVMKYPLAIVFLAVILYFGAQVVGTLSIPSQSILMSSSFWVAYLLSNILTYTAVETLRAVYSR